MNPNIDRFVLDDLKINSNEDFFYFIKKHKSLILKEAKRILTKEKITIKDRNEWLIDKENRISGFSLFEDVFHGYLKGISENEQKLFVYFYYFLNHSMSKESFSVFNNIISCYDCAKIKNSDFNKLFLLTLFNKNIFNKKTLKQLNKEYNKNLLSDLIMEKMYDVRNKFYKNIKITTHVINKESLIAIKNSEYEHYIKYFIEKYNLIMENLNEENKAETKEISVAYLLIYNALYQIKSERIKKKIILCENIEVLVNLLIKEDGNDEIFNDKSSEIYELEKDIMFLNGDSPIGFKRELISVLWDEIFSKSIYQKLGKVDYSETESKLFQPLKNKLTPLNICCNIEKTLTEMSGENNGDLVFQDGKLFNTNECRSCLNIQKSHHIFYYNLSENIKIIFNNFAKCHDGNYSYLYKDGETNFRVEYSVKGKKLKFCSLRKQVKSNIFDIDLLEMIKK